VESNVSDRASHFLNDWFGKHIGPLPAVERLAASVRLTAKCRQDAITAGVPLQEVRDAVGGDLIRKILQLLDVAADLQAAAALQETTASRDAPALQEAVTSQDEFPLAAKTSALAEG
jgi:hypothetical protein